MVTAEGGHGTGCSHARRPLSFPSTRTGMQDERHLTQRKLFTSRGGSGPRGTQVTGWRSPTFALGFTTPSVAAAGGSQPQAHTRVGCFSSLQFRGVSGTGLPAACFSHVSPDVLPLPEKPEQEGLGTGWRSLPLSPALSRGVSPLSPSLHSSV